MTFNSYDVCAQIRLDWAEGRYDASTGTPGKKCPGGYTIPANKQCGGAGEGEARPGQKGYKRGVAKRILKGMAQGANKGVEAAQGAVIGENLGRMMTNAAPRNRPYSMSQDMANTGLAWGGIGAVAGGVKTAAKEFSAYRKEKKARKQSQMGQS